MTGLDSLHTLTLRQAERRPRGSIEEMAQQFEAVFVAQMLKVMRESVASAGLFEDAPGKDVQMAMMDEHLARELVKRGGFGIAEQIRVHLESLEKAAAEKGEPTTPGGTDSEEVSK